MHLLFTMLSIYILMVVLAISEAYVNIALYRPAYQQYPYKQGGDRYDASNAVDGRKSNLSFEGDQCAASAYNKQTATWWVDLTSIHNIHKITIYFLTANGDFGSLADEYLGFSVYVSNTTDILHGTLCFKDNIFTINTIPPVFTTNCFVRGQYVIYYNERLTGVVYPSDYYTSVYIGLCEVEVYGCPTTGYYGSNCSIPCSDVNCQYCHIETGTCQGCKPGYQGHRCELECERGFYGIECSETCGHCRDVSQCSHINGTCLTGCEAGFKGGLCKTGCDSGSYGVDCNEICGNCVNESQCSKINGTCFTGCNAGFEGNLCKTQCNRESYGIRCNETCEHCLNVSQCSHINGTCLTGCEAGLKGGLCKTDCDSGSYGVDCNEMCGNCLSESQCSNINGTCFTGCKAGHEGDLCKTECNRGSYGYECNKTCGHCRNKRYCFPINGTCLTGCDVGYEGALCKTRE
ncbi:multiple epidermal growth factor-like domains protein 10 [Crassostrea angulata]|uniref:multiple epidermal growth factor-like domains protein 10 n=1 Tax=Magallana angulata TaxID=2784310 RepID=UPI0022B1D633|nr:multiple epidermal growth factor-like domains protein 10 [Crassostrea angulata]